MFLDYEKNYLKTLMAMLKLHFFFFEVVRGRVSCKMGGETVAEVIVMDATRSAMCFSSEPADLRTYDADKQ